MHGAGGGAPKGNKNALRHGLYTAEAVAMRQAIRTLLRGSRELLEVNRATSTPLPASARMNSAAPSQCKPRIEPCWNPTWLPY